MSDPLSVIGTVLAEKFRVERLLGEGGFGVVYAGTHLLLNEPIAVKFMKVDGADSERATAEFLREARILFSLSHPAIVRMYDVGALARGMTQMPWVVLELLQGPTLDQAISERRRQRQHMSAGELQQIFDPILDALAFAHARDVIHRDIKPANILLSRSVSGALEPKLLDFGTARSQSSTFQTSAGKTGFTPLYAASEQWDPSIARPTPATDVYSMGLTILECATLHKAFGDIDNIATLMRSVATGTGRPRLAEVRPDLPPQLHATLERAVAVNPPARFRDGAEFHAALKQAFSSGIVSHAPAFASSPSYSNVPVSPHAMTSSPPVAPLAMMPQAPYAQTTSPFVMSRAPTHGAASQQAPAQSSKLGCIAVAISILALLVVIGGVTGAALYLRGDSSAADPRTGAPLTSPQRAMGAHAISAAMVTPNSDFEMADAAKIVRAHQSEIEECAAKSAKWSGEIGIAIEVSATDGHVIGATCHTNWPKHDSKNPAVDPNATDFCGCTQTVIPKWKFKAPKADVVFPGVEDTQTLQVKYTALQ